MKRFSRFFAVLLCAAALFALGVGGAWGLSGVTSSLVPDAYSSDGTVPIIYRSLGETFSFMLTANNPVGDVTWSLRYDGLVDGAIPDSGPMTDIQISSTTGNSVTVSGTMNSSIGYSVNVTLSDRNYTVPSESDPKDFIAVYVFDVQNRDYAGGTGGSSGGEGLIISATDMPSTLSTGEDLTFTLHGVTVTDGKITGVQTTGGAFINDIYAFHIGMEMHDENNNNDSSRGYIIPYSINSDGKVTMSSAELSKRLAGFSGIKTIQYRVDVDGVPEEDGSRISEYWGDLGSITVNIAADAGDNGNNVAPTPTGTPGNGGSGSGGSDNGGSNNGTDASNNAVNLPVGTLVQVELTPELVGNIVTLFSARSISESDVLSPWNAGATIGNPETFTNADKDYIYPHKPRMALQSVSVQRQGVYVYGVSLSGISAKTPITSMAKTGTASTASVKSAANRRVMIAEKDGRVIVQSPVSLADNEKSEDTVFFDRSGNPITEVPSDQFVVVATYTAANTKKSVYVMEDKGLPVGVVEPVAYKELTEGQQGELQTILDANSIPLDNVHYLVSDDLEGVPPEEPTKAEADNVRKHSYEYAAKLDTITVDEDGYYLVKINLPEELRNVNLKDLKTYIPNLTKLGSKVKTADIIGGLGALGDGELFGLDKDASTVLALLSLQAGEPLSLYLLKLLLFLAGCDAGLGLGAMGLFAVGGVVLLKLWKRK